LVHISICVKSQVDILGSFLFVPVYRGSQLGVWVLPLPQLTLYDLDFDQILYDLDFDQILYDLDFDQILYDLDFDQILYDLDFEQTLYDLIMNLNGQC
jgi:hypothetical protein